MPVYEYKCSTCGREHEAVESIHAPAFKDCPDCAGTAERQISNCSFSLKGHGWAKDGYEPSKVRAKRERFIDTYDETDYVCPPTE